MLSKKEWVKEKVIRWQGIRNCDTRTVDGGYLFVREDDGSVTGLGTRNVSSRAEAIAYHYGLYAEAQANIACSGQVAGAGKSDGESTPSATCH